MFHFHADEIQRQVQSSVSPSFVLKLACSSRWTGACRAMYFSSLSSTLTAQLPASKFSPTRPRLTFFGGAHDKPAQQRTVLRSIVKRCAFAENDWPWFGLGFRFIGHGHVCRQIKSDKNPCKLLSFRV